jgi:hypothetical protein
VLELPFQQRDRLVLGRGLSLADGAGRLGFGLGLDQIRLEPGDPLLGLAQLLLNPHLIEV